MKSKRKKQHEKEPNLERWLVSYADFITLLFAVFVTLFAMSIADKKKVEQVKASVQAAFGYSQTTAAGINVIESSDMNQIPIESTEGEEMPPPEETDSYAGTNEFNQIKNEIMTQLGQKGAQEQVTLSINERGLVISLKEAGFFASGSATVQPQALPLLDNIATSITGPANAIRIEGHTDNVPVKSVVFPSNWELSTARANTIVHYLIDHHKFPPAKLSVSGYGEYRPIADNSTEAGRKKNRRVDIVMLSRNAEQGEPVKGNGG